MNYILCNDNSWIDPLKAELQLLTKKVERIESYPILKANCELSNKFLAFASQVLPNAKVIPTESITIQIAQIKEMLLESYQDSSPIILHSFAMTEKFGVITSGRAEIINDKMKKVFKELGIAYGYKNKLSESSMLQLMILPDRSIIFSLILHSEMECFRQLLSPFPGGFYKVQDNLEAPSRAFKKITEAQLVMEQAIATNQLVIDLGACPGGWTYVARQMGASVISIDRSELRADLMSDPKVTFKSGDAFKYLHDQHCDWVVSDLICAPERILELLNNWVVTKRCQNFIFTIKFKGRESDHVLNDIKKLISTISYQTILKQLNCNKNEVTLMGISNSTLPLS